MVRAIWEFGHPRTQVWEELLDSSRWPVAVPMFQPETGAKFTVGSMPLVGTGYTGALDCEVTEVKRCEMIAVNIFAPKHSGLITHWQIGGELRDNRDGTSAITNIYGVDRDDPDQRVLLNVVSWIIVWIYGHAAEDLDHPGRRLPMRVDGVKRPIRRRRKAIE